MSVNNKELINAMAAMIVMTVDILNGLAKSDEEIPEFPFTEEAKAMVSAASAVLKNADAEPTGMYL